MVGRIIAWMFSLFTQLPTSRSFKPLKIEGPAASVGVSPFVATSLRVVHAPRANKGTRAGVNVGALRSGVVCCVVRSVLCGGGGDSVRRTARAHGKIYDTYSTMVL